QLSHHFFDAVAERQKAHSLCRAGHQHFSQDMIANFVLDSHCVAPRILSGCASSRVEQTAALACQRVRGGMALPPPLELDWDPRACPWRHDSVTLLALSNLTDLTVSSVS